MPFFPHSLFSFSLSVRLRVRSLAASSLASVNAIFGRYHFGRKVIRFLPERIRVLLGDDCLDKGVDYCHKRLKSEEILLAKRNFDVLGQIWNRC